MKIALAQLNYHIGHFDSNFAKIQEAVEQAKKEKCDLIVFGELAVCGYPPRDFLQFSDFIQRCDDVIRKIIPLTNNIGVIVGAPSVNPEKEGKDLYNSAYFIADQNLLGVAHKSLLPTYDVFDEYRYFEPARTSETFKWKGKNIAITICEDIWNIDNENPLYAYNPVEQLMSSNPDVLINISASPFHSKQASIRKEIVRKNASKYKVPVVYVNHVGAQTELIFDGGSMVANAKGQVVEELPYFEECMDIIHLEEIDELVPHEQQISSMQRIHDALVVGVKNYFEKLAFPKAIVGLSGGIDSALVLYLAVQALGKDNVLSLLMPSQYSSDHSLEDSYALLHTLDAPYETIPIEKMYNHMLATASPFFKNKPEDVTEENLQSRTRAILLMAFSNKLGYILLNTTNKSEAAVGYGTLYGDMCGGLSVLGDVYKTQVYELAKYINRNDEIIPENILRKPPSAELRPNQKDSDSLPDYEVLDAVLYQYIELQKGPQQIINMGFDAETVERTLKLVNQSEWKRHQMPPVLRVSSKAFGMGRRMPIVAKYLS